MFISMINIINITTNLINQTKASKFNAGFFIGEIAVIYSSPEILTNKSNHHISM